MKIAVIDTGFVKGHSQIDYSRVVEVNIRDEFAEEDVIGHGTAIISLYQKKFPDAYIYSFKVFNEFETRIELLIEALEYIYHNLDVDLINFSIGVHTNHEKLEELCEKLVKKNVVLIAAFDNNGYLSFPASYNSVIGVSNSELITNINEYIYVEDSPINILGYSKAQVVDWLNDKKEVVGNSFILPYIAQHIFKSNDQKNTIQSKLKNNAKKVISFKENMGIVEFLEKRKKFLNNVKKVVLFPVNKEVINLLDNQINLPFTVQGIYDYRFSRRLNKNFSEISYKDTDSFMITSITRLDWKSDFDTFILGHIDNFIMHLKQNIFEEIIDKCLFYKKNLIIFDEVSIDKYRKRFNENGCFIYTPNLSKDISLNLFGELWYNSVPTICVGGTSSKQGKFSLQMNLRNEFINLGYNIGQIGTEPNSELLGFDYAYPNGYGTSKIFSDSEDIMFINQLVHSLQDRELIIIGTQSNLVPFSQEHINLIPLLPRNIIIGSQSDVMILCINPSDDIEYIRKTIAYVESFHDVFVLGLVLFPLIKRVDSISGEYIEKKLSYYELKKTAILIREQIHKPVYINGFDIKDLVQECISFFSGRSK